MRFWYLSRMDLLWIFVFLGLAYSCNAANILVFAPTPTRSHYNLLDKLAVQLAKRGHQVTLVAPYKQEKAVPNLREVLLEDVYNELLSKIRDPNKKSFQVETSPWQNLVKLPQMGLFLSKRVVSMPAMQKFLKEDNKFDVMIAENFLSESAYGGLAAKYKVPHIVIAPFMANYWANFLVGNPAPASYIPDPFLGFGTRMTFFERVINTVFTLLAEIHYHVSYLPAHDEIMREQFGSHLPPLKEILKNTSMVLVNHHHSLAYPRPLLPNMIEVGGYHVPPPQPLPQDLKKLLDSSKHGTILFSMGSHLKSKDMSKEVIDSILRAFGRLKYDVIWKFEDDSLTNIPKNVKVMKWLPQSDLLAHPNVKLFITHGGLLSTIEAVTRGVPIIGIPVLGDQFTNMNIAVKLGIAYHLDLEKLTEETLYNAVQEVMNNPKYRNNMKERSTILSDQIMKPMDSAIYWIEYVIRHKGAPHMRCASQDLRWYELYMLDVFGVFFAVALTFYFVTRCVLRKICSMFSTKKTKKKSSSSKKTN